MALLLSFILVPTVLALLFAGMLYQKLVETVLKLKNKRFAHFVRGVEAICCTQECCTPSYFVFVDFKHSHEALVQKFVAFMRQCSQQRHEKVFYSWSTFMGYHYFYRNTLEAQNFVTLAKDNRCIIRTKAAFSDMIMQFDRAPMPDNNNALFHIIVYPNEIRLPSVENTKLVCFKMHHCLGDGRAFLSWLMTDLADNEQCGDGKQNLPLGKQAYNMNRERNFDLLKRILFKDKIKSFLNDFKDHNMLSGKHLKQEKYICWFNDNSMEYLNKIRQIRKLRPGCTFLDVFNTCISSSLEDYFIKHTTVDKIPETIGAGVVLSPAAYSFQYGDANFTFSNEFSVGGFFLPIRMGSKDLLAKLNICQKEYQLMKECIDVKFNYWLSDVAAALPYQIITFASRFMQLTAGISSIPGTDDKFTIFGGHQVKQAIMMPPNSTGTALHFIITTYGKQLHISLTIDKSVVQEHSQGQSIVDGIVRKIDELYNIVATK